MLPSTGWLLADWKIAHTPASPQAGDLVTITVRTVGPPYPEKLWLHYQLVDPGSYIALHDESFPKQWKRLPMSDNGLLGDETPGDGIFTAKLGPELQQHRRLVRYLASPLEGPAFQADSVPKSEAYFVYNGVPAWKGAIHPGSAQSRLSQKHTFPNAALTRVPVYHLISKREWIEAATWAPSGRSFRYGADNAYQYTGTLVYEGTVYDHIQFRARGGVWRHAMGKNMWKINFRKSQRFEAQDNFGRSYKSHWDKLNLGAGIQQGQYGLRGEHGMFDALSYKLFNLAGTPAPETHWVHFRIIDEPDEASADQYRGDFWGLYLAVEEIDASFLKHHQMPQGNLYKIEHFSPFPRHLGFPATHPPAEAYQFLQNLKRGRPSNPWWAEHVELDAYYRYRSIVECVHHYDIAQGKNYFFFYDGGSSRWWTIPWDVDLTWAEHMYGSGRDPFLAAGVLRNPERNQAYLTQLSDCRDLLFNEEEMNRLIDDLASIIDPPAESHSLVDADRAMWDYHPVMNSRYAMRHQAGQGIYYFGEPHASFEVMVEYMKEFVRKRSRWIDQVLLRNAPTLQKPVLRRNSTAQRAALDVTNHPSAGAQYQWRLAPIRAQEHARGLPGLYEIEGRVLPDQTGPALRLEDLEALPATYRVRARRISPDGQVSRWSAAIELSLGAPSSASDPD